MYKTTLLILTIYSFSTLFSQVIPAERTVDWQSIQQHYEFNYPSNQINVIDFGAQGDGITDDYQAVADAITSLDGQGGYIYFPPGDYLIQSTINLPEGCVLKGENSEETALLFNLEGNPINCLSISKSQNSEFTPITGGVNKGNNLITLESTSGFNIGDYVEIRQQNGSWDTEPISWAEYSVGQLTKILSVINNKILIESPLRIDYDLLLNPEIRVISPISNVGIQCMKIERLDEPEEGAGSNIYLYMAENCFISGVESDKSVGSHISVNSSANILIDGNYIHHAFTYDGIGTRGYGVTLSMHTSECIITNNIFNHLRHAMMIKTGSNGNIFGYNYSRDPFRSETISDASGDISLHGHYAFSNLFEGNINQNIVIDHYWGPSGPYNTFFRNQCELYGIIMTTSDILETNYQNFVGNDITNNNFLYGQYVITGNNQFEYSNNVKGTITPTGTTTLNDISYYLTTAPDFWFDSIPWPATGTPVIPNKYMIPAKARYLSGQNLTICPDSVTTNIWHQESTFSIKIAPNPAKDWLTIEAENQISEVKIFTINGILIKNIDVNHSKYVHLNVRDIKPGIYFLEISNKQINIIEKIIIN